MPTRVLELFAPDALGAERIVESLRMLQRAAALAASEATVISTLAAADADAPPAAPEAGDALPGSLEGLVRRQRSLQKQRRMSGTDVRIPVALTREELSLSGPSHVLIINFQTLQLACLATPRAEQFQVARDIVAAANALGDEIVSPNTPTPDALLHSVAALVRQRSSHDADADDGAATRADATAASIGSAHNSRPAAVAASATTAATAATLLVGDFVFKYSYAQLSDFALVGATLATGDAAAAAAVAAPTTGAHAAPGAAAPNMLSLPSASSVGGVVLTFEVPE